MFLRSMAATHVGMYDMIGPSVYDMIGPSVPHHVNVKHAIQRHRDGERELVAFSPILKGVKA